MRATLWICALLAGAAAISAPGATADAGLPPKPARYVEDTAGLLSAPVREALDGKLAAYERETSNQMLVAIFPTVPEDYVMEDFTQRTAEAWGVGQAATDNGAVLFVFPQDRKLRIEVGYGLEGAIPDATAKTILDQEITPAFRAGDFDGGVERGVDAMLAAARGEYRGTGRTNAESNGAGADEDGLFWPSVIVLLVIFFFVSTGSAAKRGGTVYNRRRARSSGGIWPGGFGGGGGGGGFGGGGGGGGSFGGGGGSFGGGGASGGW